MFKLYDWEDNVIECEYLFTFDSDGKHFIVYLDKNEDILASFYKLEGDKIIIYPIENDEDFDIVDKEIAKRCK